MKFKPTNFNSGIFQESTIFLIIKIEFINGFNTLLSEKYTKIALNFYNTYANGPNKIIPNRKI